MAIPLDVSSPDQCQRFVTRTIEAFGQVDVLVNNAGIGTAVPATHETPEEFASVLEVNLFGTYWMAQAVARERWRRAAAIINISSVLALTTAGLPQAAYSASKAGINGLTRDLAQQWTSRKNIRVNAIAPGYFATERDGEYVDDPGYVESLLPRMLIGPQGELAERPLPSSSSHPTQAATSRGRC